MCVRFVHPNILQSHLHSNQAKGAADLTHIYRRIILYLESVTNKGFRLLFLAQNLNSREITYGQCLHVILKIMCAFVLVWV